MSVFYTISTHATPELLTSDSNRFEEARIRFQFGLRNAISVNEEATWSESLSDLEEYLDHLLKLRDEGATACCGGGPILTTTRTQMKSNR
jgi:hypothetical protein